MDSAPLQIISDFPIPSYMVEGIDRARNNFAAAGARWSGVERIEIANIARAARAGRSRPDNVVGERASEMTETIASNAHAITQQTVDAFVADLGRGPEAFVEMIGVVARLVAIDTFATGIGADLVSLPEPTTDAANGDTDGRARKRSAFVPTVGAAGATSALSAVASEDRAQEDLHGSLYLSYREMGDVHIVKGLPRWQLELIAARTSLINHCFF